MGLAMANKFKWILSVFLSVVLVVGFLPMAPKAYAGESSDGSTSPVTNTADASLNNGGGVVF